MKGRLSLRSMASAVPSTSASTGFILGFLFCVIFMTLFMTIVETRRASSGSVLKAHIDAIRTTSNSRSTELDRSQSNAAAVPNWNVVPGMPEPLRGALESSKTAPTRVLYVVRTCPKYYETRLSDALATYLAEVPQELIILVGNTPYVQTAPDHTRGLHSTDVRNMSVLPTDAVGDDYPDPCPDNHSDGVTCVEGRGLFYAYERRDSFDWLFVIDDDVYAHRHNVEVTASALPADDHRVYTVGGCGHKAKCANDAGGGICGGGGYLMSKQNLVKTVCGIPSRERTSGLLCAKGSRVSSSQHLKRWMKAWMAVGAEVQMEDGSWWSDITAGCVFHRFGGLTTKQLDGLHPWTVPAKDLIMKLANDAPLSFHYVHKDEMPGMRGMHKLVAGTHRNETSNAHRVLRVTKKLT